MSSNEGLPRVLGNISFAKETVDPQLGMLNKVLRKGENLPSSAQNLQTKGEGKSPKATTIEVKLEAADLLAAGGRYWRRFFHYCCGLK